MLILAHLTLTEVGFAAALFVAGALFGAWLARRTPESTSRVPVDRR